LHASAIHAQAIARSLARCASVTASAHAQSASVINVVDLTAIQKRERDMSKSYDRQDKRVSISKREMLARQKRRIEKRVSETAHIELLDRRFDYQQSDIYEMLNMRVSTSYAE
jgi:hypothetical protein